MPPARPSPATAEAPAPDAPRRPSAATPAAARRRASTWSGSSRTDRRPWSGTAEPGATVTIYADEAPLAEVEADAQGNFVAIFKVEPSTQPRALTLGAVTPEGAASTLGGRGDAAAPRARRRPDAEPAPDADVAAAPPAARTRRAEPRHRRRRRQPPARRARAARRARTRGGGATAPAAARRAEPAPEVAATAIVRGDAVEVTPTAPDGRGGTRHVTLGAVSYAEAGRGDAGRGGHGGGGGARLRGRPPRRGGAGGGGRALVDAARRRRRGHLPAPDRRARGRRQGGEPGRDAVPARLSAPAAAAARGGRRRRSSR